ncbi:MAG: hypothetical protein K9M44_03650 [Candidatus Pacebacteria bacterium]|nr:hypothetical protein [Candidatus Paceibacterota bacterium]
MGKIIKVNDKMQTGYSYELSDPIGRNFNPEFKPDLSPKDMLELGVFGGKYMTDCQKEFPASWFKKAKLSPKESNPKLNYFKVSASQSLKVWQDKGWIYKNDPRGWFQWYCRYYLGRRLEGEDKRQIKRWKAIKRHKMAVIKNCNYRDLNCRKKQRQALLHWAYDSRKF